MPDRNKKPGRSKFGIYAPRGKRLASSDLIDPRLPAWGDLIAARRRALLDKRKLLETSIANVELPTKDVADTVYRYSKGPDFVNDELGYGEVMRELYWSIDEQGKALEIVRISQLTKTGKQFLRNETVGAIDLPPHVDPPPQGHQEPVNLDPPQAPTSAPWLRVPRSLR